MFSWDVKEALEQPTNMEVIRTRQEEREYLRKLIAEWNASRLDIFEISEPNEVGFDAYAVFNTVIMNVHDLILLLTKIPC